MQSAYFTDFAISMLLFLLNNIGRVFCIKGSIVGLADGLQLGEWMVLKFEFIILFSL